MFILVRLLFLILLLIIGYVIFRASMRGNLANEVADLHEKKEKDSYDIADEKSKLNKELQKRKQNLKNRLQTITEELESEEENY